MRAAWSRFFAEWLGKDTVFLAWLLGHFGILTADVDQEGGGPIDR